MKKSLPLLICIISFAISNAQTFEWAKHIGGPAYSQGYAIASDDFGNVYTTGFSNDTTRFDLPSALPILIPPTGGQFSYVTKSDSSGNYLWVKLLGGASQNFPLSIAVDDAGNVYSCGFFSDTTDFDPGPGVYKLGSTNSFTSNSYISKLDASGNFVWAKKIGGGENHPISIAVDDSSNIFLTGYFSATSDFDPSAAFVNLVTAGSADIYILKLNASGNFVWVKQIGSTGVDRGNALTLDNSGYIYISGRFQNTVDFDPGAGTTSFICAGTDDAFTAKFDTAGNFIWAKPISGVDEQYGNAIAVDELGNSYVAGLFIGTTNFDPGGTNLTLSPAGSYDIFIAKYDATGGFIWLKNIGGTGGDYPIAIAYRASNIYVVGSFYYAVDFDSGPGVNFLSSAGSGDAFISKFNTAGNLIWAVNTGGGYDDYAMAVTVDQFDNVYTTGFFEFTYDAHPGIGDTLNFVSAGNQDVYIMRMTQDPCSNMAIVVDAFSSINCAGPGSAITHAVGATRPCVFSWNTTPPTLDSTITFLNSGIYELTLTDANACIKTTSLLVNAPDSTAGFDLNSNLIAEDFRPGFEANVWIDAYNNNCTPVSGTLKLVLDTSLVTFNYAIPYPDVVDIDTLTWFFSNLNYDSLHVTPQVNLITNVTALLGEMLILKTITDPIAGDIDSVNNIKEYPFVIINGFDPNDKSVYPTGNCAVGYIPNGQLMTYKIRFQNTGNAAAINIFVLDTLDADLNLSSVRIVGNSHPMITEVLPGNVLKFKFDNIYLPDSLSNEPESHGYVIFEVEPLPSLANGTQITNDVGIYFDYNPPIYTNTVLNTITNGMFDNSTTTSSATITANLSGGIYQWIDCNNSSLPISGETNQSYTATASGNYAVIISDGCFTDTSACATIFPIGINQNYLTEFSVYPNPSRNNISISTTKPTELSISNLLGELVLRLNVIDKSVIDISQLNNGVYFIRNSEGNTIKFIKQ